MFRNYCHLYCSDHNGLICSFCVTGVSSLLHFHWLYLLLYKTLELHIIYINQCYILDFRRKTKSWRCVTSTPIVLWSPHTDSPPHVQPQHPRCSAAGILANRAILSQSQTGRRTPTENWRWVRCSHLCRSDGFVQDCGNSSASALELPQSCAKPLTSLLLDIFLFLIHLLKLLVVFMETCYFH